MCDSAVPVILGAILKNFIDQDTDTGWSSTLSEANIVLLHAPNFFVPNQQELFQCTIITLYIRQTEQLPCQQLVKHLLTVNLDVLHLDAGVLIIQ